MQAEHRKVQPWKMVNYGINFLIKFLTHYLAVALGTMDFAINRFLIFIFEMTPLQNFFMYNRIHHIPLQIIQGHLTVGD